MKFANDGNAGRDYSSLEVNFLYETGTSVIPSYGPRLSFTINYSDPFQYSKSTHSRSVELTRDSAMKLVAFILDKFPERRQGPMDRRVSS